MRQVRFRIPAIILSGVLATVVVSGATAQMIGPGMNQRSPGGEQGHRMQGRMGQMQGHMTGPMMGQMAGPMRGGMGPGMGRRMQGDSAGRLFGMRVMPRINLSPDDVRYHLDQRLNRLGNARLKLGAITQKDDDTIMAEVVTVDDSLVQRLAVNRHTGIISYVK